MVREPDPSQSGDTGEATRALRAAVDGDQAAVSQLFDLVYEELRRLAAGHLKRERDEHTLQPTALVHEAFLKLVDMDQVEVRGRAQFLGLASQAMRRVLVDHARSKGRLKRGKGWKRVELEPETPLVAGSSGHVLDVDRALTLLAERSERQAKVVELRFFGGLDVATTADVLGISESTVEREWRVARAWLQMTLDQEAEADG